MMKWHAVSLTLLCLLPCSAFAADEAVTIAWKPKAGQTSAIRFETKSVNSPTAWVFAAVARSKVLDVATDGKVRVQTTLSDVTLKVADQDLSGQIGDLSGSREATFLPNGVQFRAAEGSNVRLDAALQMIYPDQPVKVGDTWKRTTKSDADKGLRASEATYKYEGIEMVGKWKTYKVTVNYKETEGDDPLSARGTQWVLVEDGDSVKAEYTVKNGPFAPNMPPEDAEVTVIRVD